VVAVAVEAAVVVAVVVVAVEDVGDKRMID
jgi:hypothetical protein